MSKDERKKEPLEDFPLDHPLNFDAPVEWTPSTSLRYQYRQGSTVLQQLWYDQYGNSKWEDIPVVEANTEEGDKA